jgi:hypothetical protein
VLSPVACGCPNHNFTCSFVAAQMIPGSLPKARTVDLEGPGGRRTSPIALTPSDQLPQFWLSGAIRMRMAMKSPPVTPSLGIALEWNVSRTPDPLRRITRPRM